MAYQYLKPETIVEIFRTSKKYTESLTDRFPEYERIAANKPHGSIPKEYPKTTDGTTASIIRKTPHRVIQQLPTGTVESVSEDWLSVIAQFVYEHKIIPNANEDYALLQKCWNVVERSLTFGSCATYSPFVEHNGYFCSDLRLIYWGDVFLQPGKLSDSDSSYIFLRSWWQSSDIEKLIDSQKKIDKKNRTWDIEALERVKEIVVSKDEKSKTPAERMQKVDDAGGVELITGFQRGKGSKFYTFHMHSTGTGSKEKFEGTIVRTKENRDPRGEIPVSLAYGDIDGSNPLGRSIVELVGALQNLMDAEMQMYQYNRALMLNPPLIKRGTFSKNKLKFAPNVIFDLGSDLNASVEPLTIDTSALQSFPNNYGLMKSQMLNLLSSPDTSIGADVGNPGFSRTPQGVKAMQANLNVDDNFIRKQFETWFERWSETAINTYFAEREGVEVLQLDKKTATKLRKLAKEGKFDESLLSEDNKVVIDYSTATEQLKFEIDATSSRIQDEVQQLESLEGLRSLLDKSTTLQQTLPIDKQIELWNAIVMNSGVQDPEKLLIDEQEVQQAKDMAMQQAQGAMQPQPQPEPQVTPDHILKAEQQAHQQEMDKARLALDAQNQQVQQAQAETAQQAKNPEPPKQPQLSPEDQQVVEQLLSLGASEQQVGQALAMLHAGYNAEEIMLMLQGGANARG